MGDRIKIWFEFEADAYPNVIIESIFRAADRTKVFVTLIANQFNPTPPTQRKFWTLKS